MFTETLLDVGISTLTYLLVALSCRAASSLLAAPSGPTLQLYIDPTIFRWDFYTYLLIGGIELQSSIFFAGSATRAHLAVVYWSNDISSIVNSYVHKDLIGRWDFYTYLLIGGIEFRSSIFFAGSPTRAYLAVVYWSNDISSIVNYYVHKDLIGRWDFYTYLLIGNIELKSSIFFAGSATRAHLAVVDWSNDISLSLPALSKNCKKCYENIPYSSYFCYLLRTLSVGFHLKQKLLGCWCALSLFN